MNKVFISRPDGNVSWGFRLQGGLEYNEPLTITNIVPNSPADGKISHGDMLIEIAGNSTRQMTHKDALELIQRCGNALFLTIQKVGYSNTTETCRSADQEQQQSSYNYDSSSPSWYNNTSAMSIGNTPQAPIFDPNFTTKKTNSFMNRESSTETYPTYEQSGEIPPILAKFLSRPGGPKPFTYTPGGLDLSKLLDTARTRRFSHRERRSISEDKTGFDPIMNRRMIVPSEQLNQHHYTTVNPIQPFSYARQQPPPPPPKKHIEHDTDVITQSRSFQMLQGWISDSEKTIPNTVSSTSPSTQYSTYRSTDTQNSFDHKNNTDRCRSNSGGGTTSLPSRSFRYLQEQYSVDHNDNNNNTPQIVQRTIDKAPANGTGLRRGSDAHNPSRAFRFLQDQYDVTQEVSANQSRPVNNRKDLIEIYNKVPPSFREREPEAPRYSGATVPSRSFRFLQMMTQDSQEQDALKSNNNYTKAQQALLNKYDEQNYLTNNNRINEHPSRSFKYLQEMTGEQRPTETSTLTNRLSSTNLGASDF
ncbi:unnamed protein product [Rotaria magnacalcarata]|uniref:PDZ domain-containing protein n=1 Tax=Rotaria magnacalcarata TaxID=392030 RepID=A0A819GSY2_9BILA|nr:unnamed protein product [Rotaria magnacalcarata]CAF3886921.1 unnamed protein product [Rotaria magnacalcarata]